MQIILFLSAVYELPGFLHVGELYYLWKNAAGLGTNSLCDCGNTLSQCNLWSHVIPHVQNVFPDLTDRRSLTALQRTIRTRHTWRILNSKRRPDDRLRTYARLLSLTYRRIREVSGKNIIVDSGKYPAEAALLSCLENINPLYLHLVRDPRASGKLRATFPERSCLLRYEDFALSPRQVLTRLLKHFKINNGENPIQDHIVRPGINHTVTGNPDRFLTGTVPIRTRDDQWKIKLPTRDIKTINAITWPFRKRYGYNHQ